MYPEHFAVKFNLQTELLHSHLFHRSVSKQKQDIESEHLHVINLRSNFHFKFPYDPTFRSMASSFQISCLKFLIHLFLLFFTRFYILRPSNPPLSSDPKPSVIFQSHMLQRQVFFDSSRNSESMVLTVMTLLLLLVQ